MQCNSEAEEMATMKAALLALLELWSADSRPANRQQKR